MLPKIELKVLFIDGLNGLDHPFNGSLRDLGCAIFGPQLFTIFWAALTCGMAFGPSDHFQF